MLGVLRLYLAFELLLVIIGDCAPSARSRLPIGDSHSSQVGVCLGVAFASIELAALIERHHEDGSPPTTLTSRWREPRRG